MNANSCLIFIDGSSFLYRAFYAAKRGFTTKSGIPTGAVLIITNMLKKLLKQYAGYKIAVVFDAKGKSFRSDLYPEYKSNRPPMPEDLKIQVEYVHRIVKAMGFPLIVVPKVEADDVLGSYAKKAQSLGLSSLICTGDKDLAQLVNDKVTLIDTMNDHVYDEKGVIEKYGVPPCRIIDFLALKGDSSDNIPGMPGVGDVTAKTLINSLGGIEDIFNKRSEIASLSFRGAKTFAAKLEEHIEDVRLSYTLATIKTDVDLPIAIEDLVVPKKNKEELLNIYKELEFAKLYAEESQQDLNVEEQPQVPETQAAAVKTQADIDLSGGILSDYKSIGCKFELIDTKVKLDALIEKIKRKGLFAFDTETTSLHPEDCTLVGISFSVEENEGFYLPLAHAYLGAPLQLAKDEVFAKLAPVFADPKIKKIGHNVKFDLLVLYFSGLSEVNGVYADTMLMAHLLDSVQSCALDSLAEKYLSYKTIKYSDVAGSGSKAVTFDNVPVDIACAYSGEDSEVALRLFNVLLPKIKDEGKAYNILFDLEMPCLHVLFDMERIGALVSADELYRQTEVLKAELLAVQKDIYATAGQEFNIASPKQLGSVLFEDLAIPYPKKAKVDKNGNKQYSTAEDVLTEIAPMYDIANLVLRFRSVSKLIGTYTEKLPLLISKRTGRIHTSFNQAGTTTGRLSSSDPNLQNIPARTHEGKLIRKAFIAPQGYTLVSADYSQIELRLIAHIAKDPNLVKAFKLGYDIHKATAAEVLGKDINEITPEERSRAKATNFGLMYGMGAHGLSAQTGLPFKAAKAYIDCYFTRYPKIRDYMDSIKKFAHEHGYVETILGRRIDFPGINSTNRIAATGAERAAINAPMQGSAADIIKIAMIAIEKWIDSLEPNTVRMILQVHDELVFEVKNEFLDEATAKIKELMESAVTLEVPLLAGIGVGENWGDAH
ncbi:DNA polymerase I [Succinatimonas hippei]|uniref:DNA polymerase I n=1 Tax=Succinatimonas hippei TaxID=626938 RepID=UPI0026E9F6B2|nr:DNA polymerase I [Succinatimonas hippei]